MTTLVPAGPYLPTTSTDSGGPLDHDVVHQAIADATAELQTATALHGALLGVKVWSTGSSAYVWSGDGSAPSSGAYTQILFIDPTGTHDPATSTGGRSNANDLWETGVTGGTATIADYPARFRSNGPAYAEVDLNDAITLPAFSSRFEIPFDGSTSVDTDYYEVDGDGNIHVLAGGWYYVYAEIDWASYDLDATQKAATRLRCQVIVWTDRAANHWTTVWNDDRYAIDLWNGYHDTFVFVPVPEDGGTFTIEASHGLSSGLNIDWGTLQISKVS